MNFRRIFLTIILIITFFSFLNAQIARQTGAIGGIVTEQDNNPIPGVSITVSGPALMGTMTDISRSDGSFRFPSLPPGSYTVTAELEGFKSVKREDVTVRVGQVVTINFKLEVATLAEEVTVIAQGPVIDVKSPTVTTNITSEFVKRLPLSRNFYDIFKVVPGVPSNADPYTAQIYGASDRSLSGGVINWQVDGVHNNQLAWGDPTGVPQFDSIEEVEVIGGGMPAEIGNTGGAFVNVVSKSGGNDFSGSLQTFYTSDKMTEVLMTDEQLNALGIAKPQSPIYSWDASGTLGGPVVKDRIWFFTTLNFISLSNYGNFIPTTILGKKYETYDFPEHYWRGMIKLTSQLSKSLRFFVMFHGELENDEIYERGSTRTFGSTFTKKNNHRIMTTGNLTWTLGSDTFVDLRLGYARRWYPITAQEGYDENTTFRDGYTRYVWNGIPTWKSKILLQTTQTSARITHFKDNFLGGNHELVAGMEYEWGEQYYGYERTNPLTWWYYNGNPYYYRGYYNLDGPHPTFGDGRIQFANCGANPHDSERSIDLTRWGAYIQDAFSIRNRLVINIGIRMDYHIGSHGAATTTGTEGLSFEIGRSIEQVIGFNPFGPFEMEAQKGILKFTGFSPRIGLSYDVFGDGKTAFKVAYSRLYDQMTLNQFDGCSPSVLANYYFNWFDLNQNGQLDSPGVDNYEPRYGMGQFSRPNWDYLLARVDPNLEVPRYDEIVASISHELFSNFAIKLRYIYKKGTNFPGNLWDTFALYDRDTGRYWYSYETAPDWWVPFTTIIPAHGGYPEQQVTVYFRSQDSPWNNLFNREHNFSESKSVYNSFELSFDKRYYHGWGLNGSIVYSQYKTFFPNGQSANEFVNSYGLATGPLSMKLYGFFEIPFGFVASFFFQFRSGTPFQRTVTIAPPADWAAANNTILWTESVNVEEKGSRLLNSHSNLDVRLEKEFPVLSGKIGFFLDIYNLLGNTYLNVNENPGGTWYPDSENTNVGTFVPDYFYGRAVGIEGARTYKISIRYSF
jgi:hypothetical protein